ncbi:aldo/keto reductase [Dongia deserti]|uniref:aldo/keto reductase n=1 Tax=Dongia deserti TaxID=2268030 RepID=UPI0013C4E021|nr:aldo/keto reductase [Dongia deserti]
MSARRSRVVLQARTSSNRLPGKVLLPLCCLPIVVLAARRAARDGIETIIATSDDASDDRLAQTLKAHDVRHLRGPLDDVLARFIAATADLDDDDICVRLTSDNVFSDGDFIRRLMEASEQSAAGYAGFSGGSDGLPYGLSGEAMRVSLLRQADRTTRDSHDREHVTPWIIRRCGRHAPSIPRVGELDLSHLRCTIDTLDDYRNVTAALSGLADPVAAPWQELCRRLARWSERAQPFVPARIAAGELQASLVLGGAQFGMAYGIANRAGKPSDEELHAILDLAERHGVTHLDTAAGYGDSEHRIGSALTPASPLSIVTKLPPNVLDGQPPAHEAAQRVHVAVDRSLWLLERPRLEAVLLHRFEHYQGSGGAVWQTLLSLKAEGKIGRIGASIYRPEDLSVLLQDPEVGLVQIPFNILDRRWLEPEIQHAIAARPDVILHGRSALLQGLLTIEDAYQWPTADVDLAGRCITGMKTAVAALGRESVADLCFAYARAQPWLAGVVVGAETAAQMAENIRLFRTPALTSDEAAVAVSSLPYPLPEELLNPALWPRR